MILDSRRYSGPCVCGRSHTMVTKTAVIEPGCLKRLDEILEGCGTEGKRCVLYDSTTWEKLSDRRPRASQEIVLSPVNLHADEKATARVLEQLQPDIQVLIAAGGGTIHDTARYCARERGIRFVSVPTAATVDGFCSTVSAMTWYGFKKTLPGIAPEAVIADTEIIGQAPPALIRSGVGDILAKYTALADWQIAHVLTGEYLCPRILDLMQQAVDTVMESVPGLLNGSGEAVTSVTAALILSGLAMQMMGNSRPASGAEHHISHTIEMEPASLDIRFPAMHGEKTGVGAVLAAREYHRLGEIPDIAPYVLPYAPMDEAACRTFFGPKVADAVVAENREDCLAAVTPERLVQAWPEIRSIISRIPSPETLYGTLEQLGACRTLEDIGVSSGDCERLLEFSPLVRNRLTLMRVRRMLDLARI